MSATMTRPGAARPAQHRTRTPAQPSPKWYSDSIDLGALPSAVPAARARTRQLLREWDLEELASEAEQVLAEILANAIKATVEAGIDAPVTITLIASSLKTLLIIVRDAVADVPPVPGTGPGVITAENPGLYDENGRGLFVAVAYSARLDWKKAPGGKAVRALIRGTRAVGRPTRS